MHIKQITIFNFRSFQQQPEIHPFSPGTNCVVGRNGSGKSNLFDAIQFVLLSPRFYNLRQEERQALLHEGAGSAAVNAFVEVVFDNSDNRFSLENSDEVVLRRTIGPKKDEFFLQRKRATKAEISSLLEGAGFSKSNPYFMIQQGKIQDICTMRDTERLALLKQVAGTTVYDEKKQESLTKMEENLASIEKIGTILDDIESRLQELHGEKEELTNYQKLDRKRRAMEFTLYDKELRRARKYLDEMEHERVEHVENVSKLHEQAKETHVAIRNVEAVMKTKVNALKRNKKALQELEVDKTNAVKLHTKLKLQCEELQESIRTGEHQQKSNQKELKTIQAEIVKARAQLTEKIQPQYEEVTKLLQKLTHDMDLNKRQAEGLHAKQGRGSHFSTKEERDAYLQTNIQEYKDLKAEKESALTDLRQSLSNLRRSVSQETKEVTKQERELEVEKGHLQNFTKMLDSKKRERLQVNEKRTEQWRTTEELQEQVREAKEAYNRAQADARKVMPRATAFGLDALPDIVRQEGFETGKHYFGMLMDNIQLKDPKYQTAVEVAAQNALFHVIVDTDATAARLMKRLEDGKLGRVTFLPLNRLRVEDVQYPRNVNDVKPMLEMCLEYDAKVESAIHHVFNKKLIAKSIDIATEWSSRLGMDVITLDGDLSGRKGALTGGYVDSTKSRLNAHQMQKKAQETLTEAVKEYRKSEQDAQRVEQKVADFQDEMQRLEVKSKGFQRKIEELERLLANKGTHIETSKKHLEKDESKIAPLELEIESISADIKRLEEEMKTELTSTLSADEKQLIASLKEAEKKLSRDVDVQTQKLSAIGIERQRLQSLLEDNLLKRQQELQGLFIADEDEEVDAGARDTFAAKVAQQKDELEQKLLECEEADRLLRDVEQRLAEARNSAEGFRAELIKTKNELEKLKSNDSKNKKLLEEAQDNSDRLLTKRQMCAAKRETYAKKIQELGALPPVAERESFSGKSISDLMKSLEGINKKLKKYSHVNKKAYDQYVSFSEQRDSLLTRKDELDSGANKVKELVESLDRQKDEAINRTFRGVSSHFKDVFKELVPLGQGELVLRTAIDEPETDEEQERDDVEDLANADLQGKAKKGYDPANPDVSLYRGVSVKVRFSSVGENFLMSQLSGGQKALVALALIFAIQRCDPAPFYIFDELDQALDSAYRASVASVIQKQANSAENPTQFMVSTFRPELVQVANQCYGISHQNKVSRFHHMSKKDALSFIANLMTEEENVGDVTSLSTNRASKRSSESRKRKVIAKADDDESDDEVTATADQGMAIAAPGV